MRKIKAIEVNIHDILVIDGVHAKVSQLSRNYVSGVVTIQFPKRFKIAAKIVPANYEFEYAGFVVVGNFPKLTLE